MLVELIQHDHEKSSGLQIYLRNMMQVMDFDTRRRGRLISQAELSEYSHWLASKVGKDHFTRAQNVRCRLACHAHIARFEWLLDTIEKEGYLLRPQNYERKSAGTGLRLSH